MKIEQNTHSQYIADIKAILAAAKQQVYSAVNTAMVQAYWLIGKRIVEQEQHGKERAEYGSFLIKNLAEELTNEFGKGFSEQSLKNFRQFYVVFNDLPISSTMWNELSTQKGSTLWSQLSWSHFKALMRVANPEARTYYLKETAENNWSVRTLDRNIATQYYERLFLSHAKQPVVDEMKEKTERISHQDVGQMDMYVRMYDEEKKTDNDNPTIGIILCSETDQDIARYSILKGNEQLFASKYKLYLPTEAELKAEIEREKLNFKLQQNLA